MLEVFDEPRHVKNAEAHNREPSFGVVDQIREYLLGSAHGHHGGAGPVQTSSDVWRERLAAGATSSMGTNSERQDANRTNCSTRA
jgi:hypothetical protein